MSILGNLQKVYFAVTSDNANGNPNTVPPGPKGALGKRISDAAVAAITNGIRSKEWKQYMSLFADNAAQLARLTEPDPENDPSYLPLMRAYIVSNAVCDVGTNKHTANRVDGRIDQGVDGAPDGTIQRPFDIPDNN